MEVWIVPSHLHLRQNLDELHVDLQMMLICWVDPEVVASKLQEGSFIINNVFSYTEWTIWEAEGYIHNIFDVKMWSSFLVGIIKIKMRVTLLESLRISGILCLGRWSTENLVELCPLPAIQPSSTFAILLSWLLYFWQCEDPCHGGPAQDLERPRNSFLGLLAYQSRRGKVWKMSSSSIASLWAGNLTCPTCQVPGRSSGTTLEPGGEL